MIKARQGDLDHALELTLIVLNHPSTLLETKKHAYLLRTELEAQLTPAQIEATQAHAGEQAFDEAVKDLLH